MANINEQAYNERANVNKKEREEREDRIQENRHVSKLTFDNSVIEKIASIASSEVEGVLDLQGGVFTGFQERFGSGDLTKGVDANVGEKEAALDIEIIVEYGKSAPKIFEKIKQIVSQQVNLMTGLDVVEVNVNVKDVMTRKEYEQKNRSNNEDKNTNGGLR
ncbi:Asp23/Gls24 family envelope stress response protein [Gallicola sp. Sow4_E12]|uniref:Asp23/Gls24 family envelope stress response protein n=1 Tax=Gallicola sp. Sow4_E12 TaxID=3438785 RepID=UPI003F8F466E